MISTEDAREKGLSGHDVYEYTTSFYKNQSTINSGYVSLNYKSHMILKDTILFSKHQIMKKESESIMDENISYLPTPTITDYLRNYNLEFLKIGTALELHLKSRLLKSGYILHLINNKIDQRFKELSKKQRQQPISIIDYFEFDTYRYDECKKINRLIGLTDQSISFNMLLSDDYKRKLCIADDILLIIEDYRKQRNLIHLPGDVYEKQYKESDGIFKIFKFVNDEIVKSTNIIIQELCLNYRPLEEFQF